MDNRDALLKDLEQRLGCCICFDVQSQTKTTAVVLGMAGMAAGPFSMWALCSLGVLSTGVAAVGGVVTYFSGFYAGGSLGRRYRAERLYDLEAQHPNKVQYIRDYAKNFYLWT